MATKTPLAKQSDFSFHPSAWEYAGKGGWGCLPVVARVGSTVWDTSLWFDRKIEVYRLPLKKEIRKKEDIKIDECRPFKVRITRTEDDLDFLNN